MRFSYYLVYSYTFPEIMETVMSRRDLALFVKAGAFYSLNNFENKLPKKGNKYINVKMRK